MAEIRKVTLTAPVHSGDTAIADVLGLGSNVIVTKDVAAV
jgi:CxxC motif-containing protein